MSEREQTKPLGGAGRTIGCDEWENLLADALDQTLSPADQAAFTRHRNECVLCGQMFEETDRGRAWMEYLAVEPEVPAGLFDKILARTSGAPAVGIPGPAIPARPARPWRRVMLPVVRQALEPRLLMTAAMAFFSIALTLNLAGIKITQLRAQDFEPSRLRANLTRQFYSTNEQVTKYYENLRVVYEMESRVRELRRSTEAEPAPAPRETPKPPARDGNPSPSSKAPREQQVPPAPGRGHSEEHAGLPAEVVAAGFAPASHAGKIHRQVWRGSMRGGSMHGSGHEGSIPRSLV
jgi:hypothetical protein